MDHDEWAEIYKKLVYWELEMSSAGNVEMSEVLEMQKNEANLNFSKFVIENYEDWLNNPNIDRPLLSHEVMKKKVFPELENGEPIFFIVIDNLRFDQWKIIQSQIQNNYVVDSEETATTRYFPTTTAYARNAIFSGMLPIRHGKIPSGSLGERRYRRREE